MGIPLYLKLKSSPGGDFLLEGNSITFKSNDYHFQKIINSNELIETLDHDVNANVDGYGEGDSIPYVIFVGPTGSGKTTSLKELLQYKLANVKAPVFISAFEVSNNKFAIDLLETDPTLMKKQFQHLVRDSSKKIKIDSIESKDIILNEIFKKRLTRPTSSNNESSRSCLVVSLIQNGHKTVYMDLMGNEKFDKAFPMGNVFANMNMSSITKVLLNASVEGRSSSIITNLIFKKNEKKKINIVLNIDPNGDEELNASAFRNIADVVQQQDSEEERSPFLSSPTHSKTLHSFPVLSPPQVGDLPNYSKPTLSSLSPERRSKLVSPTRKPLKITKTRSIGGKRIQSQSSIIAPKGQVVQRRIVSEPIVANSHPTLRDQIKKLKAENFQLKSENSEMLNKFSHETTELLKVKEQLSADLLDVSSLYQQLNQERNLLKDQWKELRSDFNNFQNEHESFNELVDSLRLELDSIKQGNESLKLVNLEISTELQTVRDSMTLTTISHEEELRKLDTLNKTLETTVETYEETILEINQQNSCLVKELENKKIDESKLTKQLIKTKEKLDEYNCELHKVKEDLLMKDAELIDIKIKNSDLMSVSAQLETVSNELEDAKIQLEDTDDLFIKLNSTTAQLEVANEKIKQLEKKQEEMNKDADIARNAMSIELAQLRARLQQSNFEKEDFSRKLSQSTLAIQELSSKKEEVQMEEENSNTVGNEVIVEVEIDLEKEEISAHKGPKVSTSLDNPARLLSPAAPVSNRDQASSKASETEIDRDSCSDVPLPAFVSNPLASSFSVAPKNFQFSFSPPRETILPNIDFLDQFTNFNESLYQTPHIYEDINVSEEDEEEEEEYDEELHSPPSITSTSPTRVLQPSRLENLQPLLKENCLKRPGSHFNYPPMKSSKLRNIIYS